MPGILAEPVLTLAFNNISKLTTIDEEDIQTIWNVFTKCKDNLENGRRLENISWRILKNAVEDSKKSVAKGIKSKGALTSEEHHQQAVGAQAIHDTAQVAVAVASAEPAVAQINVALPIAVLPQAVSVTHEVDTSCPTEAVAAQLSVCSKLLQDYTAPHVPLPLAPVPVCAPAALQRFPTPERSIHVQQDESAQHQQLVTGPCIPQQPAPQQQYQQPEVLGARPKVKFFIAQSQTPPPRPANLPAFHQPKPVTAINLPQFYIKPQPKPVATYTFDDEDDDYSDSDDFSSDYSDSDADYDSASDDESEKVKAPQPQPLFQKIDVRQGVSNPQSSPRRSLLSVALKQECEEGDLRRAKPSYFRGLNEITDPESQTPLEIKTQQRLSTTQQRLNVKTIHPQLRRGCGEVDQDLSASLRENLMCERKSMPYGMKIGRGAGTMWDGDVGFW
ncbi:hypothetical protein BC832DRAFT_590105 [Gaertneriomyces semiglobifer]|nr:hypothetical protein BC832DRAFT_590105 [Gaertneriomyces semiglobifer]